MARWKACAAASTVASASGGPISCTPIGSPSQNPAGSAIAGVPGSAHIEIVGVARRHLEPVAGEQADAQSLGAAGERCDIVLAGDIHRRGILAVVPGDHAQHLRHVLGSAGHRADRVEAPRHRDAASIADPSRGGTQCGDPTQRGRDPRRSARVGSECGQRHARGERCAGAARGAAAQARGIPRVAAGAIVHVLGGAADRPLGHVELADQHGTRRAHPLPDRRVALRHATVEEPRAGGHRHDGHLDVVLERDRDPGQRPQRIAAAGSFLDRLCLLQRAIADHAPEHVQLAIVLRDPIRRRLHERDRRELAVHDALPRLGDRKVHQRGHVTRGWTGHLSQAEHPVAGLRRRAPRRDEPARLAREQVVQRALPVRETLTLADV